MALPASESEKTPLELQEAALAISRRIQERHLPHGTILGAIFAAPDSDEIVSYTRAGDSAIWTGHYLAAEAFRYAVTSSKEALEDVKRGRCQVKRDQSIPGQKAPQIASSQWAQVTSLQSAKALSRSSLL